MTTLQDQHQRRPAGVVIGGSAGAVDVLGEILSALPAHFSAPVAIVVHIPRDHPSLLAEVFGPRCKLLVGDAVDKQPFIAGAVVFAPADYHLLLERAPGDGVTLALAADELVHFSRPSIDVLFESAADALGARAIGVLLSGANEDGAAGLAAIAAAGGSAIVQDPASSVAAQMPEAGLAALAALGPRAAPSRVGTPKDIAAWLVELVGEKSEIRSGETA